MIFQILNVFFVLSISMISFRLLYPHLLDFFTRNSNLERSREEALREISIIVPTYNEEENIKEKIKNLYQLEYPQKKIEIIIVDSHSEDLTRKIASQHPVKILDVEERGKIKSLNRGMSEASNELILFTDADVRLKRNALNKAVNYLREDVKAVTPKVSAITPQENYISKARKKYYKKDFSLRHKESLLGNCCSLDGKFVLLESDIINGLDEEAFTDDLSLTIQLRDLGFRSVVIDECLLWDESDTTLSKELKKMRRRCRLSIADSLKNLDVILNWDKYSFVFLIRRFINLFIPFFLLFMLGYLFIFLPEALIFLLFFVSIISFTKKDILYYNIIMICLTIAWFDILTGNLKRGCKWKY